MSSNGQQLCRLVYVSRNRIAGGTAAMRAQVDTILEVSRRNNERDGITGALLFNEHCFAQVLEGDMDRVQATFERIQLDARHDDAIILQCDPAQARLFGDWSMAYEGAGSSALRDFDAMTDAGRSALQEMDGERVIGLLVRHLREARAA